MSVSCCYRKARRTLRISLFRVRSRLEQHPFDEEQYATALHWLDDVFAEVADLLQPERDRGDGAMEDMEPGFAQYAPASPPAPPEPMSETTSRPKRNAGGQNRLRVPTENEPRHKKPRKTAPALAAKSKPSHPAPEKRKKKEQKVSILLFPHTYEDRSDWRAQPLSPIPREEPFIAFPHRQPSLANPEESIAERKKTRSRQNPNPYLGNIDTTVRNNTKRLENVMNVTGLVERVKTDLRQETSDEGAKMESEHR
ncbi:hypothetical protein BDZ89DRAFT_1126957 [Hymenopellis radicata]|nr:hypothetical protein BDZ89DRAFT_1126957 [Hymenopellis radicata]